MRRLALVAALAIGFSAVPSPALGAVGITVPHQIDHQAKTITFTAKLFLYPACPGVPCEVTDDVVGAIRANIDSAWNSGLKFECYTIKVDLWITRGPSPSGLVDGIGIRIDRSAAGPVRSQVSTANSSQWNGSNASDRLQPTNDGRTAWGHPPASTNTYAHELGHVLGLDDTYTVVNDQAVDLAGSPHDLMNTGMFQSNAISQETVDRLANRAGITKDDLRCDLGWNVKIVWTDIYDGVHDTITFDGVVDTVPLTPEFQGISLIGDGTATGSRTGWKACNPGIPDTPSGSVPATFLAILDGDQLTVSAYADVETTLAGISTAPFTVDSTVATAQTVEVDFGPPIGTLCPHTSRGKATITPVSSPP